MLVALLVTAGACGSITVPNADSGVEPDSAVGNDAARTDAVAADAVASDAPANDAAPDTSAMTDGGGCVVQAAPDLPDDTFTDTNCDGIDGDVTRAIFVATSGADTNPGTMATPVATITAAIAMAQTTGKREVYISAGVYQGRVTLANGISLYGGYAQTNGWQRSSSSVATISSTSEIGGRVVAVDGVDITTATTVDRLKIQAGDALSPGGSSYAMYCARCTALTLKNSTLAAGRGAAGTRGPDGMPGANGTHATAGGAGMCDAAGPGAGGPGGVLMCDGVDVSGGRGGAGGPMGANSGVVGIVGKNGGGTPGSGGPGGDPGVMGGRGIAGAAASAGMPGAGGMLGMIMSGFWVGAGGANGVAGGHGRGGGGGGGGGGQGCTFCVGGSGNGGGGGGSGGCGGGGGRGGSAGGGIVRAVPGRLDGCPAGRVHHRQRERRRGRRWRRRRAGRDVRHGPPGRPDMHQRGGRGRRGWRRQHGCHRRRWRWRRRRAFLCGLSSEHDAHAHGQHAEQRQRRPGWRGWDAERRRRRTGRFRRGLVAHRAPRRGCDFRWRPALAATACRADAGRDHGAGPEADQPGGGDVSGPASDALVLFGATGDLAYKMIFPALLAMSRRGRLDMPVIGVARSKWTADELRTRVTESVHKQAAPVDADALAKLLGNLRYVSGDYADAATYRAIRRQLGDAERPTYYLAIPPSAFGVVVDGLARSGCAKNARLVVEKPFGRDLASARALNAPSTARSRSRRSSASITTWERNRCRTCWCSGSRTRSSSRSGTHATSITSRSRWPRLSAWRGEGGSTRRPARSATSSRTTCWRSWRCWPWSRRSPAIRIPCAMKR